MTIHSDTYESRIKRILDSIELRVPDRVPATCSFYFFPAYYYGYTAQQMMYDLDICVDSHVKATLEFQPDLAQNPVGILSFGPILDILGYRQMQWPGGQLDANTPFQFVEGEYMSANEYDHFFADAEDFIVRKYWPRISGALKALENLPPLTGFTKFMGFGTMALFASPEMQHALDVMKQAGQEFAKSFSYSAKFEEIMVKEGYPTQAGGMASAPFDVLGDVLRGTRGLMLDMYRRPETVLKAVEKILPSEIEKGITSASRSKGRFVHIPLHKGLDGFMSPDQFKKFFWPTLRELVGALIDAGLTPYLFWEGDCTSRLDIIRDVPPGKCLYRFEATDMFKAKDALRDRVCIRGNVPISLLSTATPDDVRIYCKKLMDYAGKDGGFILDAAASVTDAVPENLKAMFDAVRD